MFKLTKWFSKWNSKYASEVFWLVRKQGAPHTGSWAAPACQCSVQIDYILRMAWNFHARQSKYETKWKFTFISTNQKNCEF